VRSRRFVVTVVGVAVLGLLAAAGVVGGLRLAATPPAPRVTITATGTISAGASAPSITVPIRGSLALVAGGKHLLPAGPAVLVDDDARAVRPIASVAKTLTALVVLQDKPLAATETGPEYVITAQDVAFYRASVAEGGSSTFVSTGEQFTERQLLETLMLPSGNNIAMTLAEWVSATETAFVARENALAASLGMADTTITDPSGFDAGTRSTAIDLTKLGNAALANPALASIVAERSAALPSGQTVPNFNTALAQPGWLGIKTGDSDAAGGCLLFAARRAPDGDDNPDDAVTLIGAVLGEHSLLAKPGGEDDRAAAIFDAVQAVDTAMKGYVALRPSALSTAPTLSGQVTTAWGSTSSLELGSPAVVSSVVLRMGAALSLREHMLRTSAPLRAGARVGSVELLFGDTIALSWPVLTARAVEAPGFFWRLQHD